MMKRTKIVVGAVVAAVVLVVVVVAVYLLTRDDAPEAVDLETTVARIEAAEADDDSAGEPQADASTDDDTDAPSADAPTDYGTDVGTTSSDDDTQAATTDEPGADTAAAEPDAGEPDAETAPADQTAGALAGLAGVWTVQMAEDAGDLQGEPAVSFAGFRVNEVLTSVGDFTAVGRTADVSGSIELSDTALVAATVEVTMSTLRTDNSFRDGRVYQALNTRDYPQAMFTLQEPIELPAGMADGEPFSGSAEGELTIKGVTNRVTFELQAQLVGDIIVAVGSSDVVFSDYGVTAPTAPVVVSVEDHGVMEFQLIFTR